jgi:tight adherence protein C
MDQAAAFSVILFLTVMLGGGFLAYRRYYKAGRMVKHTLGAPVITDSQRSVIISEEEDKESGSVVTILQHIGEKVPISPMDAGDMRRLLILAGYRSESAVTVFFGSRVVCAVLMLIVGIALRRGFAEMPVFAIVLVVFSAVIGWMMPKMLVEGKIKRRQTIIRMSLPDALDLLVISIEAGLGLDQAIQHVSRELLMTHPVVGEELSLVTLEMRAGKRRSEALRNLSDRTGEPELRKLVAILIQNDRFGTSMGESLRTHSDFMRTRRRQEAEERAGKVGVKLVFPIFFCILPSMMVVSAGPAILQVVKYLFPMMKQAGGG